MQLVTRIALIAFAGVSTLFTGLFACCLLFSVAVKVGGNAGAVLAVLGLAGLIAGGLMTPVAMIEADELYMGNSRD